MKIEEKSKRLLLIGIIGCLLYVIGDFLFAATGKGQTTESIGFMVRVAYLEMGTWRMAASILCGFGLTGVMPVMVWKKIVPLKNTLARILATLCNPLMMAGVGGNLFTLLPWPLNQLDHGTGSFGHALVLLLGLILLREMSKAGELKNAKTAI